MSRPRDTSGSAPRHAREGEPLTDRELEILSLVAAGEPTAAISQRLGVAENTVKTHLTSVYRKTGCRNRVQATRHYLDKYASTPRIKSAPASTDATPLIRRQIEEIEARLDQLADAAAEAERLKAALEALRSIERS
jgi:DNA-binding CsgD family transcriptional regulator